MEGKNLTDKDRYLMREPEAQLILAKNPFENYGVSLKVEIYLENASKYHYNERKTYVCMFVEDEFIANSIKLEAPIKGEDIATIAEEMYEELVSKCDMSDFDELATGVCIKGYEGADPSDYCDHCPHFSGNNDSEDCCSGPHFTYPRHFNMWEMEKKWQNKYGYESQAAYDFALSCAEHDYDAFLSKINRDKKLGKQFLHYAKKRLFRW